jgi:2-dehydro-3-deoxygluconokinase
MAGLVYYLSFLLLGIIEKTYYIRVCNNSEYRKENLMNIWLVGELLLRLECENLDRFEQADHFLRRYTGAEANAGIAICSLGGSGVHLLSAVPDNPIGSNCLNELHKYGPDVSSVLRRDKSGRLGLFFLETGFGLRPSQVVYDRKESVFSRTPAETYELQKLFQHYPAPGWVHFSGTLPALSPNCRELSFELIRAARDAGYIISFDLNYRSALWSESEAKACFKEIAKQVDVLISNRSVAESFLEVPVAELCSRYSLSAAALTQRKETDASHTVFSGSLLRADGSSWHSPDWSCEILDRVGGGDAFAGAIIYALNQADWNDERRICFAAACGALKHSCRGDFSLSTYDEVEALMNNGKLDIKR